MVAGTVTYEGTPVASGEASLSAGILLGTVDIEAGGYSIRADVEPTACAATTISVMALDASGAVVGTQTRILGACGSQHIVDFAFE